MSRVLVVDDEPAVCWSVQQLLHDRGHTVQAVSSIEQAWEQIETSPPDAIVLDVRLPGEDGLTALPILRRRFPDAPVVVVTAFGDLPTAVTALGRGAFDYLVKPFELSHFARVIERALASSSDSRFLTAASPSGSLVGHSPAMQAVFRQIALIAPTDFPVLLAGETGTGKEVAARAIHQHSPRAAGPFVPVCLAALNSAVIESELFGHVRGAFTGATDDRSGLFELAANGTIFLDEIADTPLAVQVKLLRVLETGKFCPVGSAVERTTNARLVAATHRDLREMIRAATFREDLYHRLKVFTITLPALRQRREDIRPLVEYFLGQLSAALQPSGVSQDFWHELGCRHWPGNVRELKHAVEHAAVLARGGTLLPEHLPTAETVSRELPAAPDQDVMEAVARWVHTQLHNSDNRSSHLHARLVELVEATLFQHVLAATANNRTEAARLLGVDRATLRARLRQPIANNSD